MWQSEMMGGIMFGWTHLIFNIFKVKKKLYYKFIPKNEFGWIAVGKKDLSIPPVREIIKL